MIVDTSAVIAVAFDEDAVPWIRRTIEARPAETLRIPWINIAETEIQLVKRLATLPLAELLHGLRIEPVADTFEIIRLVGEARLKFPINLGDCFAYAHARLLNEPLLTLDADFLKTDLPRVLHPDRMP